VGRNVPLRPWAEAHCTGARHSDPSDNRILARGAAIAWQAFAEQRCSKRPGPYLAIANSLIGAGIGTEAETVETQGFRQWVFSRRSENSASDSTTTSGPKA
jgi:hypothetical protein